MPELEDIMETPEEPQLMLWWQWAIAVIVLLLVVWLVLKLLKKKQKLAPPVSSLKVALKKLKAIADAQHDSRKLTLELSLLTREFLEQKYKDAALFETHEEFHARHADLEKLPEEAREKLATYLEMLAQHKYSPERDLPVEHDRLVRLTENLLRGLNSTTPKPVESL